MLRENPFDPAMRKAKAHGACPVTLFDDFYVGHAAFDELCAGFVCKDCVATDEDMGVRRRSLAAADTTYG